MTRAMGHSPNGHSIPCSQCGGHGLVLSMCGEPDECGDCGGSGRNWQYQNGAIARYYSGPLIGRVSKFLDDLTRPGPAQVWLDNVSRQLGKEGGK